MVLDQGVKPISGMCHKVAACLQNANGCMRLGGVMPTLEFNDQPKLAVSMLLGGTVECLQLSKEVIYK